MKYRVLINEKTKEGKELLSMIKKLPDSTAKIVEEEAEEYLIPADKVFSEFREKLKAEYARRARKPVKKK